LPTVIEVSSPETASAPTPVACQTFVVRQGVVLGSYALNVPLREPAQRREAIPSRVRISDPPSLTI